MQTRQDAVHAEVAPEHDEKAQDAEPGRHQAAVADIGDADVHHDEVDDPGDEGPDLFGIKAPPDFEKRITCNTAAVAKSVE